MKRKPVYSEQLDLRGSFCEWYGSPLGILLKDMESRYLAKNISISYTQRILQIGSLGWEESYIDKKSFRNFCVTDKTICEAVVPPSIIADSHQLPIDTESIDLAIMPHSLEFNPEPHLILREVERVLKSEGQLLFLGFNPWSFYRLNRFLPGKRSKPPWCGNFLSRQRILDWLALLNFETKVNAGFYLNSPNMVSDMFEGRLTTVKSIAYGIKAIKRSFSILPLTAVPKARPRLVTAGVASEGYRSRGF